MPLPGQLNPSQRLLLGPGPSDVHPRVLAAMAMPLVGHLDPEFLVIMNETQEMLRQALLTRNPLTFPISATGMAGMPEGGSRSAATARAGVFTTWVE